MEPEDEERTSVRRTKQNLDLTEVIQEQVQGFWEVTFLVNSLLGLRVVPRQTLLRELRRVPVGPDGIRRWQARSRTAGSTPMDTRGHRARSPSSRRSPSLLPDVQLRDRQRRLLRRLRHHVGRAVAKRRARPCGRARSASSAQSPNSSPRCVDMAMTGKRPAGVAHHRRDCPRHSIPRGSSDAHRSTTS